MTNNEKAVLVFQANKAKGFWPEIAFNRNSAEAMALMVGELYESLEAHRKGRNADRDRYKDSSTMETPTDAATRASFELYIKDTVEDELADTVIRLLDFCGGFDITLLEIAELADVVEGPKDNYGHSILAINHTAIRAYHMYDQYINASEVVKPTHYEVSQIFTRLLAKIQNLASSEGVDLDWHINEKLLYNTGRPFLHGKDY